MFLRTFSFNILMLLVLRFRFPVFAGFPPSFVRPKKSAGNTTLASSAKMRNIICWHKTSHCWLAAIGGSGNRAGTQAGRRATAQSITHAPFKLNTHIVINRLIRNEINRGIPRRPSPSPSQQNYNTPRKQLIPLFYGAHTESSIIGIVDTF